MIKNRVFLKLFTVSLLLFFISSCGGVTPGTNPPTISSFTADPTSITEGDSSTLSWAVTDATTISINQGIGTVTGTSVTVSPTTTTTYTLTATNSAGSKTASVAITVGPGMEEAIKVVVEEVLPDIPEVQSGDPYVCLKLESPLPPGTIILEDSLPSSKAPVNITLGEEKYFFYLDLAPGSYYAHPVKYILVDKQGEHQIHDAQWWPKINNKIPDIIAEDTPDEDNIIASNITIKKPVGAVPNYVFDKIISQFMEGFIVVQGLMSSENCFGDANKTYLNGINFFNAYKNAFSRVEGLVQSDAIQVLNAIDAMADEGRSVITIFIIAHGNVDWIKLGGQGFTATQFRNKMAEYPDIAFNFILGSCHSGSFINDLNTLDNVYVVQTACASDEGAKTDKDEWGSYNDVNPADTGSEWTSSLIWAMDLIINNSDRLGTIQSMASTYGVPVTSVLICEAGFGALGVNPGLGLSTDYDLSHVVGYSSPRHYCKTEVVY
jgi:hypothetical protein